MGKDESETALPAGWEHLKARAKARGSRVSLVPDAPAPAEEPPKARRKARQAVEALDADEVMAREEQLMLRERESAVEASSEELAIRQALRKTAAGMGMASLRMTNAMNFVAAEVEIRMLDRDKIKDVPLTQLGAVLRAGAQLQEKTARVMLGAVELERLVQQQPLGDAMAATAANELDAPDAVRKLTRMASIIQRLSAKAPDIMASVKAEMSDMALEDDGGELDDMPELDEEDE